MHKINVRQTVAHALAIEGMTYTTRINALTHRIEVLFEGTVIRNDFINYEEAEAFAEEQNRQFVFSVSSTLRDAINRRYALRH